MCCFDCLGSLVLLVGILVFQGIVFFGASVISYGLTLVCVVIMQAYNNKNKVDLTVCVFFGLILLSQLCAGLALSFSKTGVKHWLDIRQRRFNFLLVKLPTTVYLVHLFAAFAVLYINYPSIQPELHTTTDPTSKLHGRFSVQFLFSISYIAYFASAFSDWLTFSTWEDNPALRLGCWLNIGCICNCLICFITELLNTFINPNLLVVFGFPIVAELLNVSPLGIVVVSVFAVCFAGHVKADQRCAQLQPCKSLYTEENKLFAKHILFSWLWLPLAALWYLEDKEWKDSLLKIHLSPRKDFSIWMSLMSILMFKLIRNITIKHPPLLPIIPSAEPVGGGDNIRRKILDPESVVMTPRAYRNPRPRGRSTHKPSSTTKHVTENLRNSPIIISNPPSIESSSTLPPSYSAFELSTQREIPFIPASERHDWSTILQHSQEMSTLNNNNLNGATADTQPVEHLPSAPTYSSIELQH